MAGNQPSERGGLRVMSGFAPAKYDLVTCTYDASGNLLTAVWSFAGTDISKLTCTYDASNNLLTAAVGAP